MRMGREETTGRSDLGLATLRRGETDKNCQPVDGLRLDAGRLGLCKPPTFVWFFTETKGLTRATFVTLGSTLWRLKCDRV